MRIPFALILAVLACPGAAAGPAASAKLIDLQRNVVGRASFQSTGHGVLIEIEANGLAPGAHAVLLHGVGLCDAAGGFVSAGPIFSINPERPHGFLVKGGPRTGDLPGQFAAADGTLHATIATTAFTLGTGEKSLFDRDGTSIVIHAGGDDYISQPEGRAGARVVCGTIIRTPVARGRKHK